MLGFTEVYTLALGENQLQAQLKGTGEAQATKLFLNWPISYWRCGNVLATDGENFIHFQPQPFYVAEGNVQSQAEPSEQRF